MQDGCILSYPIFRWKNVSSKQVGLPVRVKKFGYLSEKTVLQHRLQGLLLSHRLTRPPTTVSLVPPEKATVGVPFHDDDDDDDDDDNDDDDNDDNDDDDGGALSAHHPLSVCKCGLDDQLEKFSQCTIG